MSRRSRFPILNTPLGEVAPVDVGLFVDAVNGNDTTGDGTSALPWKTLGKFLTAASNGDTAILRSGTYHGWFASSKEVTIQGATGQTAVIASSVLYASWSKTGGQTNVYEATYTAGNCWAVWNGTTKLTSVASVAACDAASNSRYFDDAGNKLYVNIGGSAPSSIEVMEANDYAMTLSGANVTLRNLTFQWQMMPVKMTGAAASVDSCNFGAWVGYAGTNREFGFLQITGANCVVENCTFGNASNDTGAIYCTSTASVGVIQWCEITGCADGIVIEGGTGWVVTNCTINGPTEWGVQFSGTAQGDVNSCTIHDVGKGGITAAATMAIADCTIYNVTTSGYGYGIQLTGGSGHSVGDCIVYEIWRDGIYFSNASGVVVDCTAYNCGHSGIWMGGAGTTTFARCSVYLTRDITSGPTGLVYGIVVDPPSMTASIYHCVVAHLALSSLPNRGYYIQQDGTVNVKNCIALDCERGYQAVAAYTPTLTADYNCAYGCENPYMEDWSAGAHDIAADPLFVSSTDFHLSGGSPCINAGVAIAGVNDGYGGAAPDMGRYES